MTNEIVQYADPGQFLPVMSIETAVQRHQSVIGFVGKLMREGTDYGKIPGTGDKPVLLKPGAEKLSTLFGLTPVFSTSEVIEDWTGKDYDGESMFYYRYKCELYRSGNLIATSEGSCNSRESKYRWRKAERVCPECGAAAIIKGKADYGGGWLCFGKKGGCGAKFRDGEPSIESQEVGRIANPDIADAVNTIQKMAQKRALVAAVLIAVNASEFFTQDIEDMPETSYVVVSEQKPAQQPAPAGDNRQPSEPSAQHRPARKPTVPQQAQAQAPQPPTNSSDVTGRFHKQVGATFGGLNVDAARHWYIESFTAGVCKSTSDLSAESMAEMIEDLRKNTRSIRQEFVTWQDAQVEAVTVESAEPVAAF